MTTVPAQGGRRRYRSPRRQQQAAQTRELVVSAAAALFAERGWAGTGMRDVATTAGVAVETVYANFSSKSDLLLTAIDVGVVGDAEPVPLSDRPEFAALGAGSLDDRIDAAARLVAEINGRNWGLQRALNEGAVSDSALAAKLHELETRRRDNTRDGVRLVLGRGVDDDVLDALWVVMGGHVFQVLTQIRGLDASEYERWLASTIRLLLVPPSPHPSKEAR